MPGWHRACRPPGRPRAGGREARPDPGRAARGVRGSHRSAFEHIGHEPSAPEAPSLAQEQAPPRRRMGHAREPGAPGCVSCLPGHGPRVAADLAGRDRLHHRHDARACSTPIGEGVDDVVARHRGRVTAIIGALRADGPGPALTIQGGTAAAVFEADSEAVLLPAVRPGAEVVMDNLGAHTTARVRRIIEGAGAQLVFTPPSRLSPQGRARPSTRRSPTPSPASCPSTPAPTTAGSWPSPRRRPPPAPRHPGSRANRRAPVERPTSARRRPSRGGRG